VLDALRGRYSARLFVSSMVARTPAAAIGLVFVLRTKELTGSYAAAGAASGVSALAGAVCAPVLGRAVDRRGQSGVLVLAALVCGLGMAAFAALRPGVPLVPILLCTLVAGAAMPPLGACLRTLWPDLLGDPARLHAAFALESAMLEITYIAGPVLIAGAIGAWSLQASALTCAALLVGGTLVFAATPPSRAWRPSGTPPPPGGALRAAGVRTLIVVFALIGATFGAIEVAVPAAAAGAGRPHAAGVLLGLWGLGSFVGGMFAARAEAPAQRVRRLCLLLAALAVLHALLALPVGLLALGALLLLAGTTIAPSLGLAFGLVDGVAPAGTVTEAFTWLTTGIAAGLAAGSGLGGALAQSSGADAAFLVVVAAGAGAAAFAATRRHTLEPAPAPA
jgi:predicted MFS family arabinose efflux permease